MKITNDYLKGLIKEGLKVKMGKQELDEAPALAPDIAGAPNQGLVANMAAQAKAAPAPAPAPTAAPVAAKPVDRSGMTPEANQVTREIQTALGIKADGLYGKNTQAAVNKYFADKKQPLPRGTNFLDTIKKQLAAIKAGGAVAAATTQTAAQTTSPVASPSTPMATKIARGFAEKLADNLDEMYVTNEQLKAARDILEQIESQYGPSGVKAVADQYGAVSGTNAADGLTSLGNEVDDIDDSLDNAVRVMKADIKDILEKAGAWSQAGTAAAPTPTAPAPAAPAGPQGARQVAENKLRVSKTYLQTVIKEELRKVLSEAGVAQGTNTMSKKVVPKSVADAEYAADKADPFAALDTNIGQKRTGSDAALTNPVSQGGVIPNPEAATTAPTDAEMDAPLSKFVSQGGIIPDPETTSTVKPAQSPMKPSTASKPNPKDNERTAGIQRMLLQTNYAVGSKDGKPDGLYGKATQQSVNKFFKDRNLPLPKGANFSDTIKNIYASMLTNLNQNSTQPQETTPVDPVTPPVQASGQRSTMPKGTVGGMEIDGESVPVSSEMTEGSIKFKKSYISQVIKEEFQKEIKKKNLKEQIKQEKQLLSEYLSSKSEDDIRLIFEQELNEFLGKLAATAAKQGLKRFSKTGLKKAIGTSLKTAGKQAATDAAELAKQTAVDKAKGVGMSALNAISGGEDEEGDTWSAKLGNWGSAAGGLAGSLGAGTVGSIVPGAGTVAGGLAGGAAGGWAGRFAGKALGSLIDKFTSGNKKEAVSELAKMLLAGGPVSYGIMSAVKDYFMRNNAADADEVDDLFDATKERVPSRYDSILDDASDEAEDLD
jgi:predicted transcriptional regulator